MEYAVVGQRSQGDDPFEEYRDKIPRLIVVVIMLMFSHLRCEYYNEKNGT